MRLDCDSEYASRHRICERLEASAEECDGVVAGPDQRGSGVFDRLDKKLLVQPATKRGRLALAEAEKFLKEKQLFDWVKEQKSGKGLAPSYSALWRQWTHETESQRPEACDDELGRPRNQKQRTQRMRRWARRWIVIRGCYKPGPRLDLETLRGWAIWPPRAC